MLGCVAGRWLVHPVAGVGGCLGFGLAGCSGFDAGVDERLVVAAAVVVDEAQRFDENRYAVAECVHFVAMPDTFHHPIGRRVQLCVQLLPVNPCRVRRVYPAIYST